MRQMTVKSLAEEVGKPVYSVRYALKAHKLCQDVEWVGHIRLFSDKHIDEMKAHFAQSGPHNAGRPKKSDPVPEPIVMGRGVHTARSLAER